MKARCIQNSEIAHLSPHIREIWDWLLKEANHQDVKIGGKIIKRGELLRSYKDIQEGLHWMIGWRKTTYTKAHCEISMKLLKKATMITTKKTTRGMLISIVNYSKYQDPKEYESHKVNDKRATREPQPNDTINKNDKNDKELKNKEIRKNTESTNSDELIPYKDSILKVIKIKDIDNATNKRYLKTIKNNLSLDQLEFMLKGIEYFKKGEYPYAIYSCQSLWEKKDKILARMEQEQLKFNNKSTDTAIIDLDNL